MDNTCECEHYIFAMLLIAIFWVFCILFSDTSTIWHFVLLNCKIVLIDTVCTLLSLTGCCQDFFYNGCNDLYKIWTLWLRFFLFNFGNNCVVKVRMCKTLFNLLSFKLCNFKYMQCCGSALRSRILWMCTYKLLIENGV